MTEKLQPLSTQIAIPSQSLFTTPIPISTHDVPHKVETVEEEPYTIKCICNFSDDDGNTIYCETCDTWQHIDCFYPDNREEALREDFAHSCHDCKPRPLDKQKAIERTQRLKGAVVIETIDKKAKRPPTKTQTKKKQKPTDLQLNGNHSSHENSKHASPNDQSHPAKKAKTSHRPSHSTSSQAAKRSPSFGNSRTHPQGHPPSPATTPPDLPHDFEIHHYSTGFLSLYNQDGVQISDTNSFASLNVSNIMSLWLREPDRLISDSGKKPAEVFATMPIDIDTKKPKLLVGQKNATLPPDTVLRYQYLATPTAIEKDVPLMELNGQIGFQADYCANAENMWSDLTAPLPFVFFLPYLPLYIDTRKEGSLARYVRRSCKPNVVLETYISGGSEYHFWLVSDRYIAANEQITLEWDFRLPKKERARVLHLMGLSDDETNGYDDSEMEESEYQHLSAWVHKMLSEYGGCACDLGNNCAFARFHRRYHGKAQARSALVKKRQRKQNKNHTISPTSTGQATNSRAASEGHDDGPDDGASVSGSSRSKPPSRDLTPLRQGSFDTLGILTEPTDRDKRKVAMIEDTFRRIEQQQPPKKKPKRNSDGAINSNSNSKPKSSSRSVGNNPSMLTNGVSHYVDAGTSRSKSGSPSSAVSPGAPHPFNHSASRQGSLSARSRQTSVAPHPTYCDVAVQTDPVEGEWYSECGGQTPKPRKRIISLSQRLLNSRHRLRTDEDGRRKSLPTSITADGSPTTAMDIDSPMAEQKAPPGSPLEAKRQVLIVAPSPVVSGDAPMPDAPSTSAPDVRPPVSLLPPTTTIIPAKAKSPDLRVQMPPIPAFNTSGSTLSAVTTPLSASGSMVQSPFSTTNLGSPFANPAVNGLTAHHSPVRKKLSLSDYKKSRLDKTAAGKSTSLKPSTSSLDDSKTAIGLDAIVDSPTGEKTAETLPSGPALTTPANGFL
jgi:uncharacterized protein